MSNVNVEAYVITMNEEEYKEFLDNVQTDIPIKRFEAVRGEDLKEFAKDVKNVGISAQVALMSDYRETHFDFPSLNAVGCTLSHVKLWEKLVENKLKGMYIFESDAKCLSIPDLSDFLKTGADILLLGSVGLGDSHFEPINYNRKVGLSKIEKQFFQTHAYYITYEGAIKALKYVFPLEKQLDAYLSYLSKLGLINIYAYYPNYCYQAPHISSIQTKPVKILAESDILLSITIFVALAFLAMLLYVYMEKEI